MSEFIKMCLKKGESREVRGVVYSWVDGHLSARAKNDVTEVVVADVFAMDGVISFSVALPETRFVKGRAAD